MSPHIKLRQVTMTTSDIRDCDMAMAMAINRAKMDPNNVPDTSP
jgi:hypothetical protein